VVSLPARTITLAAGVALSGGVPDYESDAMRIFVLLDVLQSAISLLTFLGLQKVGTSRSQALRRSRSWQSEKMPARRCLRARFSLSPA
jgi:hypothetical protein